MSTPKKTPLCIVLTIVERGAGQKIAKVYEQYGVGMHYRVSGEGTASSDLLNILGIGTSERDVLISPAPRGGAEELVDRIHKDGISDVRLVKFLVSNNISLKFFISFFLSAFIIKE